MGLRYLAGARTGGPPRPGRAVAADAPSARDTAVGASDLTHRTFRHRGIDLPRHDLNASNLELCVLPTQNDAASDLGASGSFALRLRLVGTFVVLYLVHFHLLVRFVVRRDP